MELIPLSQSDSIGQVANSYARQNVFTDYHERMANNTLKRQQTDLLHFATFLSEAGMQTGDLFSTPDAWKDITYGLLTGFVRYQLHQGYAINSINVRLATVKAYCKLAAKAEIIPNDQYALIKLVTGYSPTHGRHVDQKREITRVGNKKAESVQLSPEQAKALKAQPDTHQGRRDGFLMCLLLDHGLRCGEVASLSAESVNLSTGLLTFYRQKVDKVQTHQLTRDTLLAAIRYFEVAKPKDKLLMGSRRGGTLEGIMSERAITDRVRVLGEKVGVHGLSAHDCRHDWAKSAIKETDIKSLQQAGGWSSSAMPLRYADDAKIANEGVKLSR
jgi:integrase